MDVSAWPMIIFTVLGQLSVGAILVLGLVSLVTARSHGTEVADRLASQTLWLVGGTLLLGFIATPFHLGQPFRAYRAVLNFPTSWLSNEIVFGIAFALLGLAFTILQWRQIGSEGFRQILGLLTGVVGLVLVYSMAMIYQRPAQPGWNSWTTPAAFFATTIMLGSIASAAYMVASHQVRSGRAEHVEDPVTLDVLRTGLRLVSLIALVALGVELLVITVNAINLSNLQPGILASTMPLLITRIVLVFIGATAFGVMMVHSSQERASLSRLALAAYVAFAVILVSEFIGRYLFYTNQVVLGMAR